MMEATRGVCTESPPGRREIPVLNLKPEQVTGLLDELEAFWQRFSNLFQRREQEEWGLKYIQGRLMDGDKRFTKPMAQRMGIENPRCLQNFIGKSPWDDEEVLQEHQRAVQEYLGEDDGLVITDGSGMPHDGTESVGVARQYCNETGKVDNCHVGIYLAYASSKGYTFLDRRLYMPEEWFSADYAERREKCGVPPAVKFQTHQELAWQMLCGLMDRQVITFRWVLGDEEFGRDTQLQDRIAGVGKCYYLEVPADTEVWLDRPQTHALTWCGRGRRPFRQHLIAEAAAPQTVAQVGADLPGHRWRRYTLHEGSKGPLVADVARVRVVNVRDGLPGYWVWLVMRRNVLTGELKYFLTNAPVDTSMNKLAWLSAARWPVEQSIEGGKTELKLNQYAMRSWCGWYHHMTLIMMAHLFLVKVQLGLQKDAPALTVSQARMLLQAVLPRPVFDEVAALQAIRQIQRDNHAAYLSHRQRTLQKLGIT
jgi:SRSO17 transposase